MNDDPDFEVASTSSFYSTSTPFLLRSACHHLGPCHEGHGIQFHSRISPSPARSFHRRRRRRSNNSNPSHTIDESEHEEISNLQYGKTSLSLFLKGSPLLKSNFCWEKSCYNCFKHLKISIFYLQ